MSTVSAVAAPRTLADAVPGGLVRSIVLVLAGAGFVGLSAQVVVPLPFTPVPLTLQTFAVLLTVAALGSVRGAASMAVYLFAGLAGVPWFSDGSSGFAAASFGYIVGFLLAAFVVGRLAEQKGADRKVAPALGLMVLGNLAIYAIGVPWLMVVTGADLPTALGLGVAPFLIGDALKIVAATALLPTTWALLNRR
ncbi:biotin transporter BioY [Microlunatus sp. Y2014]|uniref:biotin transporter BioY n=1 Tax=Microlunatus sp. Y2014 TaxID=3418488 RepID=UPI003DA7571D